MFAALFLTNPNFYKEYFFKSTLLLQFYRPIATLKGFVEFISTKQKIRVRITFKTYFE